MASVAIVGSGIFGLALAWSAVERGHRVTVFERADRPQGATVRNFGMLWPISQCAGERRTLAMQSRRRWDVLARNTGLWLEPCGSLHLAHQPDELEVLQQFAAWAARNDVDCTLLSPDQVRERTPGARQQGLLGGLFSPTEARVNPRQAAGAIAAWLAAAHAVQFEFGTTIVRAGHGRVEAADARSWNADLTLICSGADLRTLFPEALAAAGLRPCKLQMLRTVPQASPNGAPWRLGPHLASGLTLRHYPNFEVCPALQSLRTRVARLTPELDELGIHVMASQLPDGSVLVGDSHEYGDAITPFRSERIDDLILRELKVVFDLPTFAIAERWTGVYAKHPDRACIALEPAPGVRLCTGLGGMGMTLSLGVAESLWNSWRQG